jgi:hypothetical protein
VSKKSKVKYKTGKEFNAAILDIATCLNGFPLSQATAVLEATRKTLLYGTVLDIHQERFTALCEEVRESDSSW